MEAVDTRRVTPKVKTAADLQPPQGTRGLNKQTRGNLKGQRAIKSDPAERPLDEPLSPPGFWSKAHRQIYTDLINKYILQVQFRFNLTWDLYS